MPNPWTGKGNPYTRKEVVERLRATLKKNDAIIAAGAGTGISAKFIEKGGADLIIIYNSGRFRMSGHGSTCGKLDEDSLFYLMSRGIPQAEAETMLVRGFLEELVDPIEDEALPEALHGVIDEWLLGGK